jgi:hypothetical protein
MDTLERKRSLPAKTKPLSKAALAELEARRDLASELLESVLEMNAGIVTAISAGASGASVILSESHSPDMSIPGAPTRSKRKLK